MAISHAPFDELDVEDLTSVLQAGKFDIYLNGHVHNLALYSLDSDLGTYIQSGAGCMVEIKAAEEKLKLNPTGTLKKRKKVQNLSVWCLSLVTTSLKLIQNSITNIFVLLCDISTYMYYTTPALLF